MACEGDKLRMQSQYAKPFRSSSKMNLQNSHLNKSELSLKTAPIPNDGIRSRMEELYVETDGPIPAQEDEVLANSRNYVSKTMRSDDKISVDGLTLEQKKHSDPEPRNGSTSLNTQ